MYSISFVYTIQNVCISTIDAKLKIPIQSGAVRLQCAVGDGATNIAWYKDGQSLGNSVPGVSFEDDYRTLILSQFGKTSGGNYVCVAEGQIWRSVSNELSYLSPGTPHKSLYPLTVFKDRQERGVKKSFVNEVPSLLVDLNCRGPPI